MTLLPSKPTVDRAETEPEVVGLDQATTDVFSVLKSETARALLLELYEEPTVASDLADRVGTSLQNTQYHLKNLRSAGLVEVVETWYSSKGKEMNVYAPANGPLTLVIGGSDSTSACRQFLAEDLSTDSVKPNESAGSKPRN